MRHNYRARRRAIRRKQTILLVLIVGLLIWVAFATSIIDRLNKQKKTISSSIMQDVKLDIIQPNEDILKTEISDRIEDKILTLKENTEYTFESPLWIHNAFGTNESSYYLAFNTNKECYLEYTISVEDDAVPDFTRVAYIKDGAAVTKEHEYNILGFVLGRTNNVTLKLFSEDGELYEEQIVRVDVPESKNEVEVQLDMERGNTATKQTDGLYTVFPLGDSKINGSADILSYDNAGVLRSKLATWNKHAARIIEFGDKQFYAVSNNRFVMLSHLGQVEKVYMLGDYSYHHDYEYNEKTNEVYILVTDRTKTNDFVEDVIIGLNIETGAIRKVVDFEPLMKDIANGSKAAGGTQEDETDKSNDWLHSNALAIVDTNSIIISARELSAIIKVDNLDTEPKLDYIIADPLLFEGTEELPLLLEKDGNFRPQYGQHNVIYEKDDSLKEGTYYITMYNNNAGWSHTRPEIDWSLMEGTGSSVTAKEDEYGLFSYYYKYLVDENMGTYQLVDSFEVPYSGPTSNAQSYKGNFVVSSGYINTFGEYTKSGELISEFTVKTEYFLYRVIKYDFNQVWFQR